jgi:hypothetical protein
VGSTKAVRVVVGDASGGDDEPGCIPTTATSGGPLADVTNVRTSSGGAAVSARTTKDVTVGAGRVKGPLRVPVDQPVSTR